MPFGLIEIVLLQVRFNLMVSQRFIRRTPIKLLFLQVLRMSSASTLLHCNFYLKIGKMITFHLLNVVSFLYSGIIIFHDEVYGEYNNYQQIKFETCFGMMGFFPAIWFARNCVTSGLFQTMFTRRIGLVREHLVSCCFC